MSPACHACTMPGSSWWTATNRNPLPALAPWQRSKSHRSFPKPLKRETNGAGFHNKNGGVTPFLPCFTINHERLNGLNIELWFFHRGFVQECGRPQHIANVIGNNHGDPPWTNPHDIETSHQFGCFGIIVKKMDF